jgi:3-dehydroquinate synthase
LSEDAGTASVAVELGERSYTIRIGSGTLSLLGSECAKAGIGNRVAVITNPTVGALYLDTALHSLEASGYAVCVVKVPDGEEYKTIATFADICGRLVDAGLDRGGCIVALGGGVIGDLSGFAAASYLRGVPFVQVPTTLLAQVDSSVGGKTGVNLPQGKNLVGAFYQPQLVMIDVETLKTLSEREYFSGMAEVLKYGVVLDKELFELIENSIGLIRSRDLSLLESIIARCCRIKAHVVAKDELESGMRAVLNYGHTVGHAVEALAGYGHYTHGEAVAIGMVAAARFSGSQGFSTPEDTERVVAIIKQLGLPVEAPKFCASDYVAALLKDKKARDRGIKFICNSGIGQYEFLRVTELEPLLASAGIGG